MARRAGKQWSAAIAASALIHAVILVALAAGVRMLRAPAGPLGQLHPRAGRQRRARRQPRPGRI